MPTEAKMSDAKSASLVKTWLAEIDDAMKREKRYRELGQKCVDLYEAKKPDDTPFAILYSNVETLAPAVYNARPVPMVSRRYKDADPIGKAVAEVSTRTLKFLVDTECQDYDSFDDLMQPAVLDGLITNRGVTRFRYVASEENTAESVYGEAVRWDKFFHGYARTWKKVPWIGFEWDMSKDELKKNFAGAKLDLKLMETSQDEENKAESKDELTGVRTYKVYEIWDKASKKVMFFSPTSKDTPLRMIDDPLGLSSFFPVPRPLNFMRKVTTLVPTPLYEQYRQQAQELNDITRRLKAIIKAIRYRGAYNGTIEGIDKILQADDNQLLPIENLQSMGDNATIDKMIWTVPVQELAETARSLYQQRESVKQVIYEITGISDILRGASVASETATAQNIKNQWGTLRLKKMQKEVQRYCREALAIMLEIAAARFEITTLKQMTGLPFLLESEKQQVQQKMQMEQAQAQAMGQQPPPPPTPPSPELIQMLEAPSWEQIVQVLQNDVAFHYKTDIETNSTIDAEAAQDKQDISDLLNALSQFLNGIAPLVEQGILPIEIAKSMMLVISRRFNFGSQLEDALNQIKPPEPKADPAAEAKGAAEQAKAKSEAAKAEQEMSKMQLEGQLEQQEFENKKTLMGLEMQVKQAELEIKQEELGLQKAGLAAKAALQSATHEQKMEAIKTKPKEPVNA